MEIQIRKDCENCAGEGVVINVRWQNFYYAQEQFKEKEKRPMTFEEEMIWLKDNMSNYKNIPEEIPCPDCKGDGMITSWISFADLKQMIIEL